MKISANVSLLFKELPLLERFGAARRAGFDAIEIQSPYAHSPQDLRRAAEDAGLPVVLINAPTITKTHPMGLAGRPEMCDQFRSQIPMAAEYACALNARCIHVMSGPTLPAEREACLHMYADNLVFAAGALEGRQVVTEFINPYDMPGYLNDSLPTALDILERCGGQVRLQFDLYHAARTGLNIEQELSACLAQVAHIQFADSPGRHEPGSGTTDFAGLLTMLASSQYPGYLGAEYNPAASTSEGLHWLRAWREELS
jgi:hydroxypyruvate isomerase